MSGLGGFFRFRGLHGFRGLCGVVFGLRCLRLLFFQSAACGGFGFRARSGNGAGSLIVLTGRLHEDAAAAHFHFNRVRSALAVLLTDGGGFAALHSDLAGTVGHTFTSEAVQKPALVGFA